MTNLLVIPTVVIYFLVQIQTSSQNIITNSHKLLHFFGPGQRHLASTSSSLSNAESISDAGTFSGFDACLTKHQYPLWHKLMAHPVCLSLIDSYEEYNEKMKHEDDKQSFIFRILHFLSKMENTDFVCHVLNDKLLPCLTHADAEIVAFLTDTDVCFTEKPLVPKSYNRKDLWQLLNSLSNALCSRKIIGNTTCTTEFVKNFDISTETTSNIMIQRFFDVTGNCNDRLGACGPYFKKFGGFLQKFDLNIFSLPAALATYELSAANCTIEQGCTPAVIENEETLRKMDHPVIITPQQQKKNEEIAHIPTIRNFSAYEPQQIHISLSGVDTKDNDRSDGMTIMWVTWNETNSIVHYGETSSSLDQTATGTSSTYNKLDNVTSVTVTTTYNHKVHLNSLKPSTKYYYQCVNEHDKSEIFHFTSSPDNKGSFSVGIFGDMGVFESKSMIDHLKNHTKDMSFLYHIGDISYADNWWIHNLASFGYEKMWNVFFNLIQPFASRLPYMVIPGNHETECHSPIAQSDPNLMKALTNYTAYNNRFHMPSKESYGVLNMWYSFNYGNVHFIAINTESDYPNAPLNNHTSIPAGDFGNQLKWLEDDLILANANRKHKPWIVVVGHRPIYTVDHRSQKNGMPRKSSKNLQDAVELLFQKYLVDICIAGHQHTYERMTPIFNGTRQMTAHSNDSFYDNPIYPTYIVHGASGNEEMHTPFIGSKPDWAVAANDKDYGLGVLHVVDDNQLQWSFIDANNGNVLDHFVLDKSKREYLDVTKEANRVKEEREKLEKERKDPASFTFRVFPSIITFIILFVTSIVHL